ncbi:SUKH-3 domain-containing protein [Aquimarina pacifica]|uniref:SUKH-3 domain-containing protein n=1 Tax=Aquimarina pacifica TaxID=1296415 RepID=UPI0004705419|nr:SUKH-3 domain-containing protein [Aquimarina pacifica]
MKNKKNILLCNGLKEWKILFLSLLDGVFAIDEFENEIYNLVKLESYIGKESYSNLISFNYKDSSQFSNIFESVRDNLEILDIHKWNLCKIFIDAGLSKENSKLIYENNANLTLPYVLLEIYGGMKIGDVGPGQEQAKSDVCFMKIPIKSDLDEYWKNSIGEVIQVGFAHHENIILFMNNEGMMYIYIDLTNTMYLGGDFETTMIKLVFGLDYGDLVIPDRS